MTSPRRILASAVGRARPRAGGFTLLEVLVSLGIIIGALAGIAALLPAAGSRLAEATQIDRAGTMVANARADVLTRGLTAASLWQQATGTTGSTRAIVFGEGLTINGTAVAMTSATSTIALAALGGRINAESGFQSRDNVQATVTGSTVITGTGWEPGVCYGCMLSLLDRTTPAPPGAGTMVRMTTVVFRNPGPAVQGIALTRSPGNPVLQVTGSLTTTGTVVPLANTDAAAFRRRFLQGCSSVLAFQTGTLPPPPRWVPIASSWTAYAPGQTTGSGTGGSFVSLGGDWSDLVSSGTLTVFGFEGLLRVDERFVNLE